MPAKQILIFLGISVFAAALGAQSQKTASRSTEDSEVEPPVTKVDLRIVQRAQQILDSPAKWDRADTRTCPHDANAFSIYCALEKATYEVTGSFAHRGAAMQQARFVIEGLAPKRDYNHRLMDYNNDPTTTFANVQKFFQLLQTRVQKKLAEGSPEESVSEASGLNPSGVLHPEITEADIQVVQRARRLLDSPAKWNRVNTQDCPPDAKSFNLYCALATADREVTGTFDDRCPAMREARHIIGEIAPNAKNYNSRLVDYNADPATSFADIQRLLEEVQARLTKELTRESKDKKQ